MVVAAVTGLAEDDGRVGGRRLELVVGHDEKKKVAKERETLEGEGERGRTTWRGGGFRHWSG